jgi:hypothetical protein
MNLRNYVVASLLATVAASASMAAVARTNVDVSIGIGPPPMIVEEVPPPRVGYTWAPGYWGWNGHRHVWHNGYWLHDAPVRLGAAPLGATGDAGTSAVGAERHS